MNFKRISAAASAFLIAIMIFTLSSCRDTQKDESTKGLNYYFTSVIAGSPSTLDPQTCKGDTAAELIADLFTGLYRFSDGGAVVPAMAEKVTVSDDGLVWTFRLTEGVMWYGKDDFSEECTADDFVFGFQRLFTPALRSVRASEYYCIKNAEQINKGTIKDKEQLGVRAVGRYELEITLTRPRTDFKELLAQAPAMPCNRKFFELTEGQYGLVGDCVGSNGAFYVKLWHYDKWVKDGNFIELRRNELNKEHLGTLPRAVKLLINADGYENFVNGVTDVFRTSDPDTVQRLSDKYESSSYECGVWGIMFNSGSFFESSDLRIALGGCVRGDPDNSFFEETECIIPESARIGNALYRMTAGYPSRITYSGLELSERGSRAMRELGEGALSGMKLLVPEGLGFRQSVGAVIQEWQKNFGIYCMMSELPSSDYISALESGNFDAAAVRLGGTGAVSYIGAFSRSSSKNYGGVNSTKLEDIIQSSLTADNDSSAAKYCLEAEQLIIDSCWFIPMYFEKEYVFYAPGVSSVEYDPSSGGFGFMTGKGG